MTSKYVDLKKAVKFTKGAITSKVLNRGGRIEATLFCMARGTAMSEHTSSREAHILVLKGKGVFNLAGRPLKMVPGIHITMKPGTKHALKASGNVAFLLLLA
jgi:quercetin dioxygenase-like cupin family protein